MGGGSSATASSADLSSVTLSPVKIDGLNNPIYPGIKNWLGVSVKASKNTASASGTYTVSYKFTATVTTSATFATAVKYTLYKTTSSIATPVTCPAVSATTGASPHFTRICTLDSTLSKATVVKSGSIATTATTSGNIDVTDTVVANGTTTNYYYLVIEYPNADSDQSADMGKTITGNIGNVTATNLAIS